MLGGGGGNVTFPGIGLSRGIPLSLILVCTSGPPRSGMFRWSWCRVLYNWRERQTRPLEHASSIAQFMQLSRLCQTYKYSLMDAHV